MALSMLSANGELYGKVPAWRHGEVAEDAATGARAEVNTANLNVSGRAVRRASRKATWRLIPFLIL